MSQLTIYLDKETREKVGLAAKREGLSVSRWACDKLSSAADEGKRWPDGFFELFGSVADEHFEKPTNLNYNDDIKRELL